MTTKVRKKMIDTTKTEHYHFKVHNSDNFYSKTTKGKALPLIDTLKNVNCYETIPSTGKFERYNLKSYLKTSLGYTPACIEIRDIPFTWRRFRLIVDVSLPKVLRGHNVFEIYDYQFKEIIDAVFEMLLQFGIEISKYELETTTHIRRIDYCKNILIDTPIIQYVFLLQRFKKPWSITFSKYDTTVIFGTKKKKLVIYDKAIEVIRKSLKCKDTPAYKIARLLITLQEIAELNIFRIEQRLYGRQAIVQEVSSVIGTKDITFKDLYSEKVASHVLSKHWQKVASEDKFKTLLLGEQNVNVILEQLVKIAKQQGRRNVNPLYVLYPKLLSDIGEEATSKAIKGMRENRTLIKYKNELYSLIHQLPMYGDTRLKDYRTITQALSDWEKFSLPIISK